MSSYPLNNITAPDAYDDTSTIDKLPVLDHINIDVSNQGIYWQLQLTGPNSQLETLGTWDNEVYMGPGSRSLFRAGVVGIRIRAAVAAANLPTGSSQAQVTIEAVAP